MARGTLREELRLDSFLKVVFYFGGVRKVGEVASESPENKLDGLLGLLILSSCQYC